MCKTSIFKNFSLFIQLYIAKVLIGSGSGYGSGENFPDPDPTKKVRIRQDPDSDPQPWFWNQDNQHLPPSLSGNSSASAFPAPFDPCVKKIKDKYVNYTKYEPRLQ